MARFDQGKKEVRRIYDLMVGSYDFQYREEQVEKYRVVLNILKLGRYDSVLDVGCGTGLFIQMASASTFLTVGVDTSRRMLEKAKVRCGARENVCLVCGDADHLPFQKESFDRVYAISLIQNILNPKQTIQELIRVARPDSKIVITAHRRIFTKQRFTRLLEEADLNVEVMVDSGSKDRLAVCTRIAYNHKNQQRSTALQLM